MGIGGRRREFEEFERSFRFLPEDFSRVREGRAGLAV